jgi:trk system potassium uptake protein TrkH
VVPEEIMRAVFTLVVLFLTGHFIFGVLLVLLGADLVTGFSAALACLGNVGPGFGPAGPMGNFAGFPDLSKLILTFAMWIGRLEIVTVLALFHPDLWREARLTG